MRKIFLLAAVLCVIFWSLSLPAFAVTVTEVTNPRVNGGWVTDMADLFTSET